MVSRGFCVAMVLAFGVTSASAAGLPTTADNVVILAQEMISFGPRAQITAGQVVVNDASVNGVGGLIKIGPWFAALSDTQVIADTINLRGGGYRPGPVFFDAFANTLIRGRGALTVDGTMTTGTGSVPLPLLSFPGIPVVTAGSTNLVVRQADGTVTLPPGSYGQINVGLRGTLIFTGGTYNVESLRGGLESNILFNGTTTLNVAGRVSIGALSVLGPQGGAISPRCIVINVGGDRVRVSAFTEVEATVSAPGASVNLGSLGTYLGNFVGKTVYVGFAALVGAPPALTSACS